MAKYYYYRYSIKKDWVESTNRNLGIAEEGARSGLTSEFRYYDSVAWNGSEYVGVGSGETKGVGLSPITGKWLVTHTRNTSTSKYAFQITSTVIQIGSGFYRRVNQKRMSSTNVRGDFLNTIVAEDGAYPANGISGSYWYVKRNKAFPEFKVKADGQLRTSEEGWVKINGVLRPIEQMWVKVNGVIREV